MDGETAAWLCGAFAGAIAGGLIACAFQWRALRAAVITHHDNGALREALRDLQCAEGNYRQRFRAMGADHPDTLRAHLHLVDTGNCARRLLMMGRK